MNNEIEFSASAHNLLLKTKPANTDRQAHKNQTVNIQALPQAARKKRYTKLDLALIKPLRTNSVSRTHAAREAEVDGQENPNLNPNKTLGLIGPSTVRNCPTHD
ncbi:unnamed protein product [Sphagnum troendelagicum]|jgi:hypothetical protein